jgi:hypothetical protein
MRSHREAGRDPWTSERGLPCSLSSFAVKEGARPPADLVPGPLADHGVPPPDGGAYVPNRWKPMALALAALVTWVHAASAQSAAPPETTTF